MNERITEQFVRTKLQELKYQDSCIIEEQKSQDKTIERCLSKASKSGKENPGRPEFIIRPKEHPNMLLVVECKADITKHKSDTLEEPKVYAVDGALHYAKALSQKYNVIAIAVSGEKDFKVSSYIVNDKIVKECSNNFLDLNSYLVLINNDGDIKKQNESKIISFAEELHNYLRDYAKLSENEKPLLVGGILICLRDDSFIASYRTKKTGASLASLITGTIKEQLQDSKMLESKIRNMLQPYSFIETHPVLSNGDIVSEKEHPLLNIIDQIETNLKPYINTYHEHDILGHFYGEFLSYSAGDKKGLGIVLTPKHIKELMCDLVGVNKDSIVLDTCTGTGGFLITAMSKMIEESQGNQEKITNIKTNQLIGIEQQPHMFALAVSNMLLRGDGKANVYNSSCFGIEAEIKKHKPTVALLNPPYSQKGEGLSELDFIYNALECLEPNGLCAAIVPTSCSSGNEKLKEKILLKHTLIGQLSLPMVFKNVGVVPSILVFQAHKPHNKEIKTWFGYCKDDGFIDTKKGRIDSKNRWTNIKKEWVDAFKNKEIKTGLYITKAVSITDEWLAEAYLEPDYSKITENDIIQQLRDYQITKENIWNTKK